MVVPVPLFPRFEVKNEGAAVCANTQEHVRKISISIHDDMNVIAMTGGCTFWKHALSFAPPPTPPNTVIK